MDFCPVLDKYYLYLFASLFGNIALMHSLCHQTLFGIKCTIRPYFVDQTTSWDFYSSKLFGFHLLLEKTILLLVFYQMTKYSSSVLFFLPACLYFQPSFSILLLLFLLLANMMCCFLICYSCCNFSCLLLATIPH